jgi:hypothetical protein
LTSHVWMFVPYSVHGVWRLWIGVNVISMYGVQYNYIHPSSRDSARYGEGYCLEVRGRTPKKDIAKKKQILYGVSSYKGKYCTE